MKRTRSVGRLRRFRQWLVAQLAFGLLNLLKLLPADAAIGFSERMARRIGPRLGRHRLILANLRHAFPEKGEAEIEAIARGSWGQIGRLAAEYVFLDRLFDLDPARPAEGRIEVTGTDLVRDLKERPRPFIFFTAHTGNFELLPVVAAAFGHSLAVLFRPPNNPYIADKVFRFRNTGTGRFVPSHTGSSLALARQLEGKGGIGVLVDQKFRRGLPTAFFGQPVRTNPLVARLARQFDCEVIPARCIRLPGNRFRIEVGRPLDLPRDDEGGIDIAATTQLLNDRVESWVREYPDQWLWYHDRWDMKSRLPGP